MKLKKKYKNRLNILICILIIILTIILILHMIKKEHNVKYNINNYNVEEKFYIIDKKHNYDLIVSNKKNKYNFSNYNDFDKSKKIVKKVVEKESDKTKCIILVYKDKTNSNVLCNNNKQVVSLNYLKDRNKEIYNKIIKMFKKDKYNIDINDNNTISIYKDNIDNNEIFTLWNYKGLFKANNNESNYKKLLDEDKYENDLALLVDKFYVFMDTNNKYNGFKLYYYDILKDKLKIFDKTKYKIDDDVYFCGTYNKLLYIYDKRYKKQYTFNPSNGKLKKVGDKEKGFYLLKNNKLELVNYYEFKEILYFNSPIKEDKLNELYNPKEIYLIDNYYYIYSNEGNFYKVYIDNIKDGILLFKMEDISSYIIKNNRIIFTKEDTLYNYDETNGLRRIIDYNELIYNYKNMYDYYKKN